MNNNDKGKLKVLIKMILIHKSPQSLTANQITNFINDYNWGFKTDINSTKVGRLMSYEMKKHDRNFMDNICSVKKGGVPAYYIKKGGK